MSRPPHPFSGSLVALPTPFTAGALDHRALARLIERQVAGGSDGIVVAGSTGEAALLSPLERVSLCASAVGAARGRLPVVCGIGTSDTRFACELARQAEAAGADGLLATTPPYVRPTQEGLVRHYAEIAAATRLPIALYDIPARTGVRLLPQTVARIAASHANVVAIKAACRELDQLRELVELDALAVLCGEDRWIAEAMALGAAGVVGVVANLVPERVAELVHAFRGTPAPSQAPALVESLAPLVRALFLESNPAPLKAALELLALCREELRLPLVPIGDETRAELAAALRGAGLSAEREPSRVGAGR